VQGKGGEMLKSIMHIPSSKFPYDGSLGGRIQKKRIVECVNGEWHRERDGRGKRQVKGPLKHLRAL